MNGEPVRFTQRQQTADVVNIRIRQNHIAHRIIPKRIGGVQISKKSNLFSNIRRTVQ
jgi:hypothetical protein